MNDFVGLLNKYENIVIFGYSSLGERIYHYIKKIDCNKNIYYCDNSLNKQGGGIRSVEETISRYPEALFIIVSRLHIASMSRQLLGLNIKEENIVMNLPDCILADDEVQKVKTRLFPRAKIRFEVDIAEHCNLKCRSCHHFSPLAEELYTSLDVFRRDFKRLSDLFKGVADRIYLLGGEPLLNKRLEEYLVLARSAFEVADIELVTNGILLFVMPASFWKGCKNNRIVVTVTKYPLNKDGKLFTCVVPPNINHFNKYFHKNLLVSKEDYIDIYQEESHEKILEFLSRPIPFCKYCNVNNKRTYNNKWMVSKKEINEWT